MCAKCRYQIESQEYIRCCHVNNEMIGYFSDPTIIPKVIFIPAFFNLKPQGKESSKTIFTNSHPMTNCEDDLRKKWDQKRPCK